MVKFTIKELNETPETGETVDCVLEMDGNNSINFKFALKYDSPNDINKRLVYKKKFKFF